MKEEVFLYFIGTAGSGKSTLTKMFNSWMQTRGLDSITVNLDPGAENLPYEPDVDVRDWISLDEVMDSYKLGPNGAQIACADMLAMNAKDIKESIESFKTDYVLVDTPGQLELFVFRESGKFIVQFFRPDKSMIAYLIDPAIAKNASGFASQMLLSINTNFRLGQSQVNVLTKTDTIKQKEKEKIEQWAKNPADLYNSITMEDPSIHREMSEKIVHLLEDFKMQSRIVSTNLEEFKGIEDLYTKVQLQFAAGEDLTHD